MTELYNPKEYEKTRQIQDLKYYDFNTKLW